MMIIICWQNVIGTERRPIEYKRIRSTVVDEDIQVAIIVEVSDCTTCCIYSYAYLSRLCIREERRTPGIVVDYGTLGVTPEIQNIKQTVPVKISDGRTSIALSGV